jgi:hypothetical protein
MNFKISYVVIFIVSILFCLSVFSQTIPNERQLTILNKTVDFGDVKPDTILTAKFFFVNSGKKEVQIEYVNPDCSCTSYFLSKKVIYPSDTAYVELSLNTENKYGKTKIYSTMKANTFVEMYKFTIIANVLR